MTEAIMNQDWARWLLGYVEDDIIGVLRNSSEVLVSGRPMAVYSTDGQERMYDSNEYLEQVVVRPFSASICKLVGCIGLKGINPDFHGSYATISAEGLDGTVYRFGMTES
ncbi:hypothetical protein KDA11_01295, partial [Candidatus Saccharibacteria bacterium]|nr:hypothetical protein [Candidatus Saccharibacteria bacterium]